MANKFTCSASTKTSRLRLSVQPQSLIPRQLVEQTLASAHSLAHNKGEPQRMSSNLFDDYDELGFFSTPPPLLLRESAAFESRIWFGLAVVGKLVTSKHERAQLSRGTQCK